MRISRSIRFVATLAATLGLLLACGGPPPEPPEVQRARALLDEAWTQGGPLIPLTLSLAAGHNGFDLAKARLDEGLASTSPAVRLEAARALAAWDTPESIAALKPLVAEGNSPAAMVAARALARHGDASGKDLLAAALRDADGGLQTDNCLALAKVEPSACISEALKDLGAKDAAKAATAAATLGLVGDASAREPLRAALKAAHGDRRAPLVEALGRVGNADADAPFIAPLAEFRESAVAVIRAFGYLGGDAAIKQLRTYLTNEDKGARTEAAIALLRAGVADAEVLTALQAGAGADEAGLRYLVASNLGGQLKSDELAAVLAGLAGDPEASIRAAAMRDLAEYPGQVAVQGARFAWDAGKDAQDGAAYEAALAGLLAASRRGGDDAKALLVEALESPNWAYSLRAAMGILHLHQATGRSGGPA